VVRKVLDGILKEITTALLESDVNVKLVASLKQKIKAKVKATFEGSVADKIKESNRKNVVQKVRFVASSAYVQLIPLHRLFSMN